MNKPSCRFTLMKILVLVSATAFGLSKYELKKKRSVQRQVLFPLAITLTSIVYTSFTTETSSPPQSYLSVVWSSQRSAVDRGLKPHVVDIILDIYGTISTIVFIFGYREI